MGSDLKSKVKRGLSGRYAVLTNIVVIIAIAFIGIWIVYISIAIFTKHGEQKVVPSVENMTYTNAVKTLHEAGFNVDIRDSVFRDDVNPGYVIEQFPKARSIVKPGRKIFLYINAVHPKEVIVDDSNNDSENALKGWSYRQAMSRLNELGFKNIHTETVRGEDDRIVKITANGRLVRPMERIPVNARMVVYISDGSLSGMEESYIFDQIEQFFNSLTGSTISSDYQSQEYSQPSEYNGTESNQEGEYEEPEYF